MSLRPGKCVGLAAMVLCLQVVETAIGFPDRETRTVNSGEAFINRQQLVAGGGSDVAGFSVSIDGQIALVGAQTAFVGAIRTGAVFVFEFDPGTGIWLLADTLSADDGANIDLFGTSVALAGNTAVVGAPGAMVDADADQGAAYVFIRNATTGQWSQQDKLVADDGAANDAFGVSVDVDGDLAVVGTEVAMIGGNAAQGAGYAFNRNPATGIWAQEDKLIAPDGVAQDRFGFSVGLSGQLAAISAYNVEGPTQNQAQGAVYVFQRGGAGLWNFQAKLFAFDGIPSDNLGLGFPGVAIDGDIILAGAPDHMNLRGAAYTFVRSPVTGLWSSQDKLIASDGVSPDMFGQSVALSGGTALIGAPFVAGPNFRQGAAYFFTLQASGNWLQRQQLLSGMDGEANDNLGRSVAISQTNALAGAPFADPAGNVSQGAAYVFACGDVLFADNFEAVAGCAR